MKVPLLDLQAQYRPLRAELLAAIERVCDSQRFIMGPEIAALEDEMARRLGVRHAIAVSSGTDALLLALMALDVKPGDEVITPTYSFFATAGAVAAAGRGRGPRASARGRFSWISTRRRSTSTRLRRSRPSRRGRRRSSRSISSASAPTWIR